MRRFLAHQNLSHSSLLVFYRPLVLAPTATTFVALPLATPTTTIAVEEDTEVDTAAATTVATTGPLPVTTAAMRGTTPAAMTAGMTGVMIGTAATSVAAARPLPVARPLPLTRGSVSARPFAREALPAGKQSAIVCFLELPSPRILNLLKQKVLFPSLFAEPSRTAFRELEEQGHGHVARYTLLLPEGLFAIVSQASLLPLPLLQRAALAPWPFPAPPHPSQAYSSSFPCAHYSSPLPKPPV